MSKTKVHKNFKDKTPCGVPRWKSAKRAKEWKDVTCKLCLAKRPPFKINDYPPKENNGGICVTCGTFHNPKCPTENKFEDMDEVWDEERYKEETKEVCDRPVNDPVPSPYDKWKKYFELCCDHSFYPQPDEVWNGAIDTICMYLRNELCTVDDLGLSGADEILSKTKKKFKTEQA